MLLPPGQSPPRKGSCPGGRPSWLAAAEGLDFRIILLGFNAPLEFLMGFTLLSFFIVTKRVNET
jgi:hypothetical protein